MLRHDTPSNPIRIHEKYPQAHLNTVWKNLHQAPISDELKATWYQVIHDVIPNNSRLHRIHLTDSPNCAHCGKEDTTDHRLVEFREAPVIWNMTRTMVGSIMRTDGRHIPTRWTVRPDFHLWKNQKRQAVVWLIAHHVQYVVTAHCCMSMIEYLDF
jgi:hypothetical protein